MTSLPEWSNIDQLRKQAKELLRDYRRNEPVALERFRSSLPAARGKDDASLIAMELQLHDAQSCIAREYGFDSWTELKARVEWQQASTKDLAAARLQWLRLVYGGPTAGGHSFFGRPVPQRSSSPSGPSSHVAMRISHALSATMLPCVLRSP